MWDPTQERWESNGTPAGNGLGPNDLNTNHIPGEVSSLDSMSESQSELSTDDLGLMDIPGSLTQLPEDTREAAIAAYLFRKGRPTITTPVKIPTYLRVETSIPTFNSQFPLGPIFQKWKKGIPIWPKVKHSVGSLRDHVSPTHTGIIKNLLESGIISKAQRSAFLSNFFLVPKDEGRSVRPIFDFSHLTKHLNAPHFYLPSIFQLIIKDPWPKNMYYVKLDLKDAFHNIPLKDSSKYITTFRYDKKYYSLNKLPMGLSISPFVMQRFTNAILNSVRSRLVRCWGHIDDMLLAHTDPEVLRNIVLELVEKLTSVGWRINFNKSILKPTKSIIFLGALWGSTGVRRTKAVSVRLCAIWRYIKFLKLTKKPLQRTRGLFNYYLNFAGRYHSVVNRILKLRNKKPYDTIMKYLLGQDFIKFREPKAPPDITVYSDASLYRIAAVLPGITISKPSFATIAINELRAALLAVKTYCLYYNPAEHTLDLRVDNMNVIYLIQRGSCKWLGISIMETFQAINQFTKTIMKVTYIASANNIADAPSRLFS